MNLDLPEEPWGACETSIPPSVQLVHQWTSGDEAVYLINLKLTTMRDAAENYGSRGGSVAKNGWAELKASRDIRTLVDIGWKNKYVYGAYVTQRNAYLFHIFQEWVVTSTSSAQVHTTPEWIKHQENLPFFLHTDGCRPAACSSQRPCSRFDNVTFKNEEKKQTKTCKSVGEHHLYEDDIFLLYGCICS